MKEKIGKIAVIGIWVILISGLFISLGFVEQEQDKMTCKSVDINIKNGYELFFMDRKSVLKTITDNGDERSLIGAPLQSIAADEMEALLEQDPFVYNAEVFLDVAGELRIEVTQRNPIIRIMKRDGSGFYIDEEGKKMPLSDKFSPRILIATGNIFERFDGKDSLQSSVAKDLYNLALFLNEDEESNMFWKAQIEQVHINSQSELILVPKVGNHEILIGNSEKLQEKFRKLMIFYKEGLSKVGWNKYKSINLKFENQIICTKI